MTDQRAHLSPAADLLHAAVGQSIGTLVACVARMTTHPAPIDLMRLRQVIQALPQVHVLHGLVAGRAPSTPLPVVYP